MLHSELLKQSAPLAPSASERARSPIWSWATVGEPLAQRIAGILPETLHRWPTPAGEDDRIPEPRHEPPVEPDDADVALVGFESDVGWPDDEKARAVDRLAHP